MDTRCIPNIDNFTNSISWQTTVGTDVGGMTSMYLHSQLHPMVWSRYLDFKTLLYLRVIPKEIFKLVENIKNLGTNVLLSDLYLESFAMIHLRGSSNWQKTNISIEDTRINLLKIFLNNRLRDNNSLNWSINGAFSGFTTLYENESPLAQSHTKSWLPNEIMPIRNHGLSSEKNGYNEWMGKLYDLADEYGSHINKTFSEFEMNRSLKPLPLAAKPRTNLK